MEPLVKKSLDSSHLRFNPLLGEWILVAPKRGERPQSEKAFPPSSDSDLSYDPNCFLCPGNVRAGGIRNPKYRPGFTFDNDFPALSEGVAPKIRTGFTLIRSQSERGVCRVTCYSADHHRGPARLDVGVLQRAVEVWTDQSRELGAIPWVRYVQIFENHGPIAGASSSHPHSQIWASSHVPSIPLSERAHQKAYLLKHQSCLLCDYVKLELSLAERVVCENDSFLVVTPYWSMWPFETMVLSKRHLGTLAEMTGDEKMDLAKIMKAITTRYDNIFQAPFAYSMGLHQSPMDSHSHPEQHFHMHYNSPMKSGSVQKVLAGYELVAGRQRDDLPETAAARLRSVSDVHYLERPGPVLTVHRNEPSRQDA